MYRFREGQIAACWYCPKTNASLTRYGLKRHPVVGTDIHAVACAVPMDARDLVLPDRFEYADAFVVTLPPGTRIAAEEWARELYRAMFMPRGFARQVLAGAWNAVIGLEPPPNGSALGPFQLVSTKRGSAILVGEGERYRVRLVVLAGKGSLTLATFVQSRGGAWRELLRGIMVGHRRVAPLLLERTVAAKTRKHRTVEEASSR